MPWDACSAIAMALSKLPRVGLPVRPYSKPFPCELSASKPFNLPSDFWANVVAILQQ